MDRKIYSVAGLLFGDEGKGSTVDYLVRRFGLQYVIRYNGGSQPGHNVEAGDIHHCFSQFGSGTLVPGVKTILSRYMLVNPINLDVENEVLKSKGITDAIERLIIDAQCPIITPINVIINRMYEIARGAKRHGSCGKGIGQTASDLKIFGQNVLFAGDFSDKKTTRQKLDFFWHMRLDLAEQLTKQNPGMERLSIYLDDLSRMDMQMLTDSYYDFSSRAKIVDEEVILKIIADGGVVFEGAQGVLLDQTHGFYPHTTWSDITFRNADDLISRSGFTGEVEKIGVLRAYATRHGAGPFVTEDDSLSEWIKPCHNKTNDWQGRFRVGWFDCVAASYALKLVGKVDSIALTNIDRLYGLDQIKVCRAYQLGARDEASNYFDLWPDGRIFGINVLPGPDVRQTQLLAQCEPEYFSHPGFASDGPNNREWHDYVHYLQNQLSVPIKIVSFGPKASDKFDPVLV